MVSEAFVPAVYGPVHSWRFGQSLGIDVIGAVSTCSYNCVYCQLGSIERVTCDRDVFVSATQVQTELAGYSSTEIDVVTFSGSGEPTLALNLKDIMEIARTALQRPIVVLTNGTLLGDRSVQQDLDAADIVSIKLDAVSSDRWHRVNRPAPELSLEAILAGLLAFREHYRGQVAVQTMVMEPWSTAEEQRYIAVINALQPHEVQLNTPLRPRPLRHQLEARGNHADRPDHWRQPRHMTPATLMAMGDRLQQGLDIPVRHRYEPPQCSLTSIEAS
jgi:wyosine [tRNA(Phe)-imidazoG37] synthetase (radical SAM superfamily)